MLQASRRAGRGNVDFTALLSLFNTFSLFFQSRLNAHFPDISRYSLLAGKAGRVGENGSVIFVLTMLFHHIYPFHVSLLHFIYHHHQNYPFTTLVSSQYIIHYHIYPFTIINSNTIRFIISHHHQNAPTSIYHLYHIPTLISLLALSISYFNIISI